MKIVYIAGPYIGDGSYNNIEKNIVKAEKYAIYLANKGVGFFCPHLNSRHFEIKSKASEEFYVKLDIQILKKCDVLMVIPEWRKSKGVRKEIKIANDNCIPIYFVKSEFIINDMISKFDLLN